MTRTRDSRLQRGPLARLAWRITLWSNERARTKRSQRELQERYVGTFGGLGGPGSAMSSGAPAPRSTGDRLESVVAGEIENEGPGERLDRAQRRVDDHGLLSVALGRDDEPGIAKVRSRASLS